MVLIDTPREVLIYRRGQGDYIEAVRREKRVEKRE
jgi:hypothetical protein